MGRGRQAEDLRRQRVVRASFAPLALRSSSRARSRSIRPGVRPAARTGHRAPRIPARASRRRARVRACPGWRRRSMRTAWRTSPGSASAARGRQSRAAHARSRPPRAPARSAVRSRAYRWASSRVRRRRTGRATPSCAEGRRGLRPRSSRRPPARARARAPGCRAPAAAGRCWAASRRCAQRESTRIASARQAYVRSQSGQGNDARLCCAGRPARPARAPLVAGAPFILQEAR